jgi:meiosis-specific with OB domain-containing protein
VILKNESKTVHSNNIAYHKLDLTIRDSPNDYINVTCWGSIEFINQLEDRINFLDIVRIKSPKIKLKSNGSSEKYRPTTLSPYELAVSESDGNIETDILLERTKRIEFEKIKIIPICKHDNYYTLEDVEKEGEKLIDKHINLLFGIKEVTYFCLKSFIYSN